MQTAPARAHPASRLPTAATPPGTATDRTKVSSAAVEPTAACGPSAPANRTANPNTAMPMMAGAAPVEHSVPAVISTTPAAKSPK